MGTNYYLHKPLTNVCSHCGRSDPPQVIHLGKSSLGWCFSLHVDPDDKDRKNWNLLCFWLSKELRNGSVIRNEYGEDVSLEGFKEIVAKRKHGKDWDSKWWCLQLHGYTSEEDFHFTNHSERGPNGLFRHKVDGVHCIGHGDGTYDYIIGEFS